MKVKEAVTAEYANDARRCDVARFIGYEDSEWLDVYRIKRMMEDRDALLLRVQKQEKRYAELMEYLGLKEVPETVIPSYITSKE